MQNDWGLTNTQIGLSFTVYTIVQTTGLFLSLYIADRYSKKILLPFGLIGVGLCGLYLSTLPSFTGYLICFAAMAFFADVVYWPVLLKAVRLLGHKKNRGGCSGFWRLGAVWWTLLSHQVRCLSSFTLVKGRQGCRLVCSTTRYHSYGRGDNLLHR
jgi:sugar phosphate permease